MNKQLNNSTAKPVLFEIIKVLKKKNTIDDYYSQKLIYTIKFLGGIIGLFKYDAKHFLEKKIIIPKNVLLLIKKRNIARSKSNWLLADSIRDELFKLGFKVNDHEFNSSLESF